MTRTSILLLLAPLWGGCASSVASQRCEAQATEGRAEVRASEGSEAKALARLMAGRFDNHLQVLDDEAEGVDTPHGRIHSIFTPVSAHALGEHLLYVEQYTGEDPSKVYRRRLYRFVQEPEGVVRLEIASFVDESKTTDLLNRPEALGALGDADLDWKEGCEVRWRRQGDHFIGATARGACRVPSRRGGTLLIEDDLRLDANALWIHDRAFDEAGERVFGHPEGVPHKLVRAATFKGWAALKDPKDPTRWIRTQGSELHDQGSEVALVDEEGKPLPYVVRLAQRVYRKSNTAILKMTVRERGSDTFLTYTWTAPDSERVGVNLGDFQSGLTRVTPQTLTTQAPQSRAKRSAAIVP